VVNCYFWILSQRNLGKVGLPSCYIKYIITYQLTYIREPLPESSLDVPPPVGPKPPEPPSTPLPKAPTVERSESENEKTNQQIVDAKEQKRLEKERKKKEKEEKVRL
jgi:hypothetical protein